MKQLGWTTLEQSKQLVAAGLDPNTADMHIIDWRTEKEGYYDTSLCYSKWDAEHVRGYLPCWSLGALIGLMPTGPFIIKMNGVWSVMFDRDQEHSDQFSGETLMETLCEAIEWLLENNYIKKGK